MKASCDVTHGGVVCEAWSVSKFHPCQLHIHKHASALSSFSMP